MNEKSELVKVDNIEDPSCPFSVEAVDLNSNSLPSLENAQELPIDLSGSYWTPESEGDLKKVYFGDIKPQKVLSINGTEGLVDLECVILYEEVEKGIFRTVINGSRRLVGILEQYVNLGLIRRGTPLKIIYKGKHKNKTNAYMSDNWSIRLMKIELPIKDAE